MMFDQELVLKLRRDIVDAMERVITNNPAYENVKFKLGVAEYADNNVTFKRLEFALVDATGTVNDKKHDDFVRYARSYGLSPDDIGARFVHKGTAHIIMGLKPRNRRYPVITHDEETGDSYKFPVSLVKRLLHAS